MDGWTSSEEWIDDESKMNGRRKKNGRVAYWSEGATALQKEGEKERTAVARSGIHCRY